MKGLADSWGLIRSGAGQAAENMAIDETLLLSAESRGYPVLRFYSWQTAAATFGYFQKFSDIEQLTALRPLIRRPTGGGLVPHDSDWTYSVVIPPGHEWFRLRACESYRQMHRWVVGALGQSDIAAELAPDSRDGLGSCFAGFEKDDVLLTGRKIAGAAQRRRREGLLIQGSIQPDFVWDRKDWENGMIDWARENMGIQWSDESLQSPENAEVGRLLVENYENEDFQRRR